MSESEEEWVTVRRRRRGKSGVSKHLKVLAIPVVPLAFDALAEPDERPAQESSNFKKKKTSKKSKVADADGDVVEHDQSADKASSSASTASAAARAGTKASALTYNKTLHTSFLAWLWSRLVALLMLVGLMPAAGSGKKKRRSKTAAQKAATALNAVQPPPQQTAKLPEEKDASTKDKPPAAGTLFSTEKEAPNPQKQHVQKPVAQIAGVTMAPAAATDQTPTETHDEPDAPSVPGKAHVAAAAAKAAPAAATAAALKVSNVADASTTPMSKVLNPTAASSYKVKPVVVAVETPQPPPATPSVPLPPAIKYDADWGRGKFVMQSIPFAHGDVVSAVALAGDIAVSAGYDGAVKLWHWPLSGSSGGGVSPHLAMSRALVGHNGRVEALVANAESRRLATTGRDSTLKVWDLGSEPGGTEARELASTYVYESVRSLAVDWAGEGAATAGRVVLGARSGTVLLYSLGSGGTGRKLAALRGHRDEVTSLKFLYGSMCGSGQVAVSGSRDATVRLWDLRTACGAATAVLTGLSGRVCSLSPLGQYYLMAGDCSTTVKMWDLRKLPPLASSGPPTASPRRLPNAPLFAGDACPTAGLWWGPRSGVLLSSCMAWWTNNKLALEEAPPSAKLPTACINVAAVGEAPRGASTDADDLQWQYQYTLRLGPGIVTCLAGRASESAVLVGAVSGALWALQLVRGGSTAAAAAERAAAASTAAEGGGGGRCEIVDALVVGAEEFSDDEYDDRDEDEDDE